MCGCCWELRELGIMGRRVLVSRVWCVGVPGRERV